MSDTIIYNQRNKFFLLRFRKWFLSQSLYNKNEIKTYFRDWIQNKDNFKNDHNLTIFIDTYNLEDKENYSWYCFFNTHLYKDFVIIKEYLEMIMKEYDN